MEFPAAADEVGQIMISISDEEIAWPVLQRMTKALGWMLVDLDTGRSFGG
jgi:hypothetical protein